MSAPKQKGNRILILTLNKIKTAGSARAVSCADSQLKLWLSGTDLSAGACVSFSDTGR